MRKNGEKSQEKREKPDFELGKIQKRSAGLGYLTSFAAVFFLLTPLLHVQTDHRCVCVLVLCPAAYNKISHHVRITQPNSNVWFFLVEIDFGMTGASYELICKHLRLCNFSCGAGGGGGHQIIFGSMFV